MESKNFNCEACYTNYLCIINNDSSRFGIFLPFWPKNATLAKLS